jgi:hypothetical protein
VFKEPRKPAGRQQDSGSHEGFYALFPAEKDVGTRATACLVNRRSANVVPVRHEEINKHPFSTLDEGMRLNQETQSVHDRASAVIFDMEDPWS